MRVSRVDHDIGSNSMKSIDTFLRESDLNHAVKLFPGFIGADAHEANKGIQVLRGLLPMSGPCANYWRPLDPRLLSNMAQTPK